MRHLLACLLAWMTLVVSVSVRAQDAAPVPVSLPETLEVRGMDCIPQVKEVETRRAIPFQCQTDYEVSGVELRYRTEGEQKWSKIDLERTDTAWEGTIPCGVTAKRGVLKVYVFSKNDSNKVVGRVGRHDSPMSIRIVDHSSAPPPALPNKNPPARCFEKNDCPPEMLGTAACPGTKANKETKRAWGASCALTSDCQDGLECVNGSCDHPAKCDNDKDCPTNGECNDGLCHVPDAEELKDRLGPPKHHWLGVHVGVDFLLMREATGVCGTQTEDSKTFSCYEGGNSYTGVPNQNNAGHLSSSLYLATIRALVSYDYAVGRLALGARLGWAFRGAPKNFSPVHAEARFFYSLKRDPFKSRFRPYLGLVGGYAQVDASGTVEIVDCTDPATRAACATAVDPTPFLTPAAPGVAPAAVRRKLNAYREGGKIFFGPALMMLYAFSNDSGIQFNLNTMFPDLAFEPSLGYVLAL